MKLIPVHELPAGTEIYTNPLAFAKAKVVSTKRDKSRGVVQVTVVNSEGDEEQWMYLDGIEFGFED